MKITSFKKKLSSSEIGGKRMNDKYLTFKSKVDYLKFYEENSPKHIEHIDKVTKKKYIFRYDNKVSNGEVRHYEMGTYFNDKNALVGDEIFIEKSVLKDAITFEIDLIKNNPLHNVKTSSLPDEEDKDDDEEYDEGTRKVITVNKFERNSKARSKCIEHHGAECSVCDFDFNEKYGKLGNGFIHVHHLLPVSKIGKSYKVDPIKDLIPVCPNCHAMIHKKNTPYTIKEMKALIK